MGQEAAMPSSCLEVACCSYKSPIATPDRRSPPSHHAALAARKIIVVASRSARYLLWRKETMDACFKMKVELLKCCFCSFQPLNH
jgi:hypothetical protein